MDTTTKPHVRLHSWWQNGTGTRTFICIGKGFSQKDKNFIAVTFLEVGKTDSFDLADEDLMAFMNDQNLVPYQQEQMKRA